jgi:heme exporter protein B
MLIFFVFFPVNLPDLLALFTIIIIGTIGIVALGNIISAISSNLAQSGVMLPVLLIPVLLFTIIMTSIGATSKVFAGAHLFDVVQEIRFILVFNVVFIAIGYLLIDYVLED